MKSFYGTVYYAIHESVDGIVWCDHSNETSSAVLLNGTVEIKKNLYHAFKHVHYF